MIIDGYNVIFAWGPQTQNLEDARQGLLDVLDDYAGYTGEQITVVFDGYRTKRPSSELQHGLLKVVFTAFGVTADTYIQRLVRESSLPQKVVTGDYLEQLSVFYSGAERITPTEFKELIVTEREKHVSLLHKSSLEGRALKKRLDLDAISVEKTT